MGKQSSETYVPTIDDLKRRRRCTANVMGNFTYCRFYHETTVDLTLKVDCDKHGIQDSCQSCYTCANCAGRLYYSREQVDEAEVQVRILHAKRCHQCSVYLPGETQVVKLAPPPQALREPQTKVPACSVDGCKHKAWDHRQVHKLFVCDSHFRQVKTWQRQLKKGEKTEAERPLILNDGVLVENPFYNKKRKNPGVK